MKISVVIPTFNRSHTLPRAIDSVKGQTVSVFEVIVVDDGSTDDTPNQIDKYPDVRYIQQDNAGVSAARNTGIQYAKGDWIALLDSDDEWMDNKIALQLEQIKKFPTYRLCHGDELWIRNGKHLNQMKKHQKQGGWIFEQCLPLCAISPSASLIRKDLLVEMGLFDTDLPACEDYDLWLKICSKEPILYIDEPILYKHGGHADQLSQKYWGMDRFRIKALYNILDSGSLNKEQFNQAHAMFKKKVTVFANGAFKRGRKSDAEYYRKLGKSFDER